MTSELVRFFLNDNQFSLQLRTDILDVFFGLRQGSRIICRIPDELESVVKYLISFELSIAVGKGLVVINSSDQIFDDYFEKPESSIDRGIPLYVSKNQVYADELKASDENNNDFEFGSLLSYPPCCINSVIENKRVPRIIDALKYLTFEGKYNIWCWPVASIGDASLLSHFPCSFNCKPSSRLALKRFGYIQKYGSNSLLERIIKMHSVYYYLENNKIMFSHVYNANFIGPNNHRNEFRGEI